MKILRVPHVHLSTPAQRIVTPLLDPEWMHGVVADMIQELRRVRGAGLAAPQVGVPLQLLLVDPASTGTPLVMLNPIRNGIGTSLKWDVEQCLSCPGVKRRVRRRKAVSVEWFDLRGQRRVTRFDGFAARVVQHEIDHLAGLTIVDLERAVSRPA
jgi:peptide deformylase